MTTAYDIREAALEDVLFLSGAILGAEMSGSARAGLATLFDLSLEEARHLVAKMLQEEIDGCEFSVSSYLVACMDHQPVAAVAGWVEGRVDDMPSGLLKSNLIGFTFPPEKVRAAAASRNVVKGIQIERQAGALQIEYVFVDPAHRGNALARRLILAHFARTRANHPDVGRCQVQVFADNTTAIGLYEGLGFRKVRTFRSDHPEALRYLPCNEKLLMETNLNEQHHG